MFASWPMVFGALVAGLIAGFLIPEATQKQKSASSSVVAAKTAEATKVAEPKRALPTPKTDSATAPAPTTNASATAPQKSTENEDCERQTWPYLTPNCLDRSAQAAKPDVVVKTKMAEPKSEGGSEEKPASAPSPTTTVSTAPKTDSPPKADMGGTPKDAAAATANSATNPASNEADPEEKRQADRQQTEKQPAQAAAAPEKSARRPAARARTEARAEVLDEPLRPRAERYRGERRYAGQIDDEDDRPVYIRRGGRLYLAPEYHHHLRMQDRYWREW